jgi:acetyl-CoA carboxylase biotin carboxyl carrier protein
MNKRKASSPGKVAKSQPSSDAPERHGPFAELDLETVRELARIAAEFDLAEVETDPSGHVRVARRTQAAAAIAPVAHAPTSAAPLSLMPPPSEKKEDLGTTITSPFVGTFYRQPSPEAPLFVEVGQTIRKGQVVCIVEAMKLMNEIESDVEGKVLEVLVENGAHVEYGQALFRIEKI